MLAETGPLSAAIDPRMLLSLGLVLARTGTFVVASPLFGVQSGFEGYKISLIVCLTAVFWGVIGGPLEGDISAPAYVLLASREALIGFFLAFVFQLVQIALRTAGELIGHEMGLAMSGQVDPLTGLNTPAVTRFFDGLFLLGLLAVDGHHILLQSLGSSFERAPIGRLRLDLPFASFITDLFLEMLRAGLGFAAPVMVVLALVSLMTGLLSRAVPQLNILELSFTLRVSFALIAMFLFAPMLAPAMNGLYRRLDGALDRALFVLEG